VSRIPGVLFFLYMAQIGMVCAKPSEELTSPDVLYPCMRVLFVKAEATQYCPFHQHIQTRLVGVAGSSWRRQLYTDRYVIETR
jgi:hypothetical protein